MLYPTKGDARKAPGNQAGVDRVEAVEETGKPGLRSGGGARVDVLRRTSEERVGPVRPDLHVLVVDRAIVLRSGVDSDRLLFLDGGGIGSGHFVGEFDKKCKY